MNWAEKKQIQIYKKMSAQKKIELLDDFYRFAKVLKKEARDHPKICRSNQPNLRKT